VDAELRQLRTKVRRLQREKAELERFAAMAAHEVLMPLIMSEASAKAVRERTGHGIDLDSRRQLDGIVLATSRARLLVEALLGIARDPDRGVRREAVDLTDVLHGCVELLTPQIEARGARVTAQSLPVVECDPTLVRAVLGNLLGNAVKFAPSRGHIRISSSRLRDGWVISIDSPGPAIAPAERNSIFEPWRRGRGKPGVRGYGLGLALVRQIVERHGGKVGVVTAEPGANRFYFTLPDGGADDDSTPP
jgi:signal transduction histidine kinase